MTKADYQKRLAALKSEGSSWLSTWKDIQPLIAPHRGYFSDTPNNGSKIDHKVLIDSTAVRSLGTLAAGMTSGLTSPSRPWFKLGLADNDLMQYDPVKYWLEDVESRLLAIFAKSKIYANFTNIYEEIGAFGTASMILLPDYNTVIRGRHFTAGEYYLDQDGDNRVDTFAREYQMNVGQVVKTFGEENVSDAVLTSYKRGDLNSWVKIGHVICPNDKYRTGVADSKGKKFTSVYFEIGKSEDEKFLRVAGFNSFPVMAPRWGLSRPSDVYGRSAPGWMTLGDTKMLQKMQKDSLVAIGKVINPPMIKPSTMMGAVNTVPGGVSAGSDTNPNAGLRPAYQINPDLSAIENKIRVTQEAIRAGFFADLFLMLATQDNPQMTAREVVERHEEKLLVLGPLLESLEGELLDLCIDRSFEIALESGAIPLPPKELQGMDLKVEYISPLAQAQKMVGVTAIEQGFRFVGGIAAVDPSVMDNVDVDEAVRQHLTMDGVSPKIIKSPEAVAEIRKARADAQAQQQALANAQVVAQGAQTLSQTPVGQNSALDAVMAGLNGSGAGPGMPA